MDVFKGKKILLLAPKFYGYEKEIKTKMEDLGAEVTYINCNPSDIWGTMMSVFSLFGISKNIWIRQFEKKMYTKIENIRFDYVLMICGWAITSFTTHRIRQSNLQPNGKMILYYWDSLQRLQDDIKRRLDFDVIFTFDKDDFSANKSTFKFLPLFYCDRYWKENSENTLNDVMVVGSFRLNRLDYIKKLQSANPNLNIYAYLYTKKWIIAFHKFFRKKYNNVHYSDLKFEILSPQEVIDLYMGCKAVLDIPANGQSGLAIRTFEALAMHKKLITSNSQIQSYDFYDSNNIFVISDKNYSLPPKEWFCTPFTISDEVIEKYSIGSWLKTLIADANK